MSAPAPGPGPALSVILPTDTYETVRNELTALRRQTVRDQLEIVIITEDGYQSITDYPYAPYGPS